MNNQAIKFALIVASSAGLSAGLQSQTSTAAAPHASIQSELKQSSTIKLPDFSGPFGVGREGYEWTDAARPDRYSSNPQGHRALMVYLWYPTNRNAAGARAPYIEGAKQMDAIPEVRSAMVEEFGAAWPLIVSGELKSHAIADAPLSTTPAKFPVVLLSHGLGSTGFEYTSLIERLVSDGYIVAAVEHAYVTVAITFPGGKVVMAHHDVEPAGLTPAQRFQRMMESTGLQIREGAEDLGFVLNKLTEVAAADGSPFKGRLDLDRIAAAGHSAGGAFATGACQLDARIHACVSLDGEMPPVMAFPEFPDSKGFHQPVLLLEVDHTGDRMPFSPAQYSDFQKKQQEQLNRCPKGSYDIVLKAPGLYHGGFSDYPLLAANGDSEKTETAIHNLELTGSFTLAFLDKSLKGGKEPLLDVPSSLPEAIVKPYGR